MQEKEFIGQEILIDNITIAKKWGKISAINYKIDSRNSLAHQVSTVVQQFLRITKSLNKAGQGRTVKNEETSRVIEGGLSW